MGHGTSFSNRGTNMLSPFVIGLLALACVMAAAAIWLFAYGSRKADNQALSARLQRTIERQAVSAGSAAALGAGLDSFTPSNVKPVHAVLQKWLHAAGASSWGIGRKQVVYVLVFAVLVCSVAWWKAGSALAIVALLVFFLGVVFFFWKRLERKRGKMLEQLPSFLDNMVRLITIGTSPQAAFQMSAQSVPEPLGTALQQASGVFAAHSNLGQAMDVLEDTWRLPEFGLLAAVFRMSTQYGGRTDQVLERVAAYVRDKHAAERELHAMSAEVRLSAWVLSLLPVLVGAFIMLLNEGYFMRMWNDEGGRQMVILAVVLELVGVALLYRLAKLR